MESSIQAVSRQTKISIMAKIELVPQKDAKTGRIPCPLNPNMIIWSMNNSWLLFCYFIRLGPFVALNYLEVNIVALGNSNIYS